MTTTPSAAGEERDRRRKSSRSTRPADSSSKRDSSDRELRRQRSEEDIEKSKKESSTRRRLKESTESSRDKRDVRQQKSPDVSEDSEIRRRVSSRRTVKPSSPKELDVATTSAERKEYSAEKKAKSERRGSAEREQKRRPSRDDLEILQIDKQMRRSSRTDSIRSHSVGRRKLSDEEDNYRRDSSRLGGGRRKKKPVIADSMVVVSDKGRGKNPNSLLEDETPIPTNLFASNLEEFEDNNVEENQPKRSSADRSDSAKRNLSFTKPSLESKPSSGGGSSVGKSAPKQRPRRRTLTSWDDDPDMVTSKEGDANNKRGESKTRRFSSSLRHTSSDGVRYRRSSSSQGETKETEVLTKRLSLDSSLKLLGKSFSHLEPERKKSRSMSLSSHKSMDLDAKDESRRRALRRSNGGDRLAKSVRMIKTERPSLRRNSSLNDVHASDDSSSSSSDEEDDALSPLHLRQLPRRSKKQDLVAESILVVAEGKTIIPNNSSHSIPTELRKSSLEIFEQKTEETQRNRSSSVDSTGKTKTQRRHTEKIKKKESSQKPLRRSNSVKLIRRLSKEMSSSSDKRKEFRGKRRASIETSFVRRKSSEFDKLTRTNSKDEADDGSPLEKEEEHGTRAGESTSELEALMQKIESTTSRTGSIKSSAKSSLSSDKRSSYLQRKKRNKRRKWIAFCCCAVLLTVLVAVVIVLMLTRAVDKAELAKANSTSVIIGVGTPLVEQPSQAPTVLEVPTKPPSTPIDVAIVVIVQLDERPDETGFSLISADNSTTYVYYPYGSLSGRQSEVITEVLHIPADTEVLFTFSDQSGEICCDNGNGYYRVFSGSGEQKKSLISGDRNSEYKFTVGSNNVVQTGGIDPNEACKPCPDGKQCGRCAWCNVDRGFLPDTIFSYQCHTPPISITEKCFIGAKRVQLHNQYVAAMAKCTNGFEPWPQLQSTPESTVCVSEAKCIQKYSFVDPDCENELSGSVLVRESCQDVIGGLAFGYDYGFNAPRENECLPGPYSMADFAEAIATRCCVDGVAFCSTFGGNTTSDAYAAPSSASTGPEPTLSPTTSSRPTVSDGYQMTIVIMLDNFPRETGWYITSKDSKITYMKRNPGYYRETKLITETIPLPEGSNAIFTITDEEGDGLCCENGEGYFQIYTADGSLVVDENGTFESSKSVNVFAGKPLTLSPTISLVPSASSAPSQGLFPITIAVQFDQWASETGFSISSVLDGKVLREWSPGSFVEPNQRFVETVQLPYNSEVIFKLIDSGGDGFCCVYGDGSVTIFSGNDATDESAVIESKTGEFQSELSFSFRVGPPPTSPPTVTSVPTASNTNSISGHPTFSSPPSVLSLEVTVVVQFDKYSAETGWFIDSADGTKNYVARPLGYYENEPSGKAVETIKLPQGLSYRFKIIDLFGDGTCCWAGAGYYAMYEGKNIDDISSQLFSGDGEFGLKREHFFTIGRVQTTAPSISPMPSVSPTLSPTMKPSISSRPTENMYIVDMTIKLDSDASQTGFYIASVSDGTVYFDRPPGYYNGMDKETIEESIPLPAGQYHFALLDSGGDGFCCQNGFGFYSLYDNSSGDVLVFSDGKFGDAKNETFSVGEVSDEGTSRSKTKNGLRGFLLHRQRNHLD